MATMLKVTEFINEHEASKGSRGSTLSSQSPNGLNGARILPVGCGLPVRHNPTCRKHQILNAHFVEPLMHYRRAIERSFYENV
jgi:hypothetical protein